MKILSLWIIKCKYNKFMKVTNHGDTYIETLFFKGEELRLRIFVNKRQVSRGRRKEYVEEKLKKYKRWLE